MAELQNNIVSDIRRIIDESKYAAFGAVNSIAVQTYWNIGKRSWKKNSTDRIGLTTENV